MGRMERKDQVKRGKGKQGKGIIAWEKKMRTGR